MTLALLLGGCGDNRTLPPDASPEARAALAECKPLGTEEKQDCYEARLLAELDRAGVGASLGVLETLAVADIDVERDGHTYTHAIGIAAYTDEVPVAEIFRQCTALLQSGCYHGVIQAYFVAQGAADAEQVQAVCALFEDTGERFLAFQCLHGVGHGLTMYYGHDLMKALDGCDFLRTRWDRGSCYGGAFMENLVNEIRPHHPASRLAATDAGDPGGPAEGGESAEEAGEGAEEASQHRHGAMTAMDAGADPAFQPVRADDPHYPCSVLDDRYLEACYLFQTSTMLYLNDYDIGATARSCTEAPEAWRQTCFVSLGRDISARTMQDHGKSRSECRKAPEEFRVWCYVGVAKHFVNLTSTTDDGFSFCGGVEEEAKSGCYQAMGEELSVLHADDAGRRTDCASVQDAELERACLRGAGVTPSPGSSSSTMRPPSRWGPAKGSKRRSAAPSRSA